MEVSAPALEDTDGLVEVGLKVVDEAVPTQLEAQVSGGFSLGDDRVRVVGELLVGVTDGKALGGVDLQTDGLTGLFEDHLGLGCAFWGDTNQKEVDCVKEDSEDVIEGRELGHQGSGLGVRWQS